MLNRGQQVHTSVGTEEGSPVLRPMEVSQRTRAYHRLTLSRFSTASAWDNASRLPTGGSRCSYIWILPWMPATTARHTEAEMELCASIAIPTRISYDASMTEAHI